MVKGVEQYLLQQQKTQLRRCHPCAYLNTIPPSRFSACGPPSLAVDRHHCSAHSSQRRCCPAPSFLPQSLHALQIFIAAVDSSGNYVVPDEPLAWSSPGATLGVKFDMAGSLYICNAPLGLLQVGGSFSGIAPGSCLQRQPCLGTAL